MKKTLVILLFTLIFGGPAFAQDNPEWYLMNIHGWVFNVFSGDPVDHHKVYYRSYNNNAWPQKDSTLTNSWGHYHFDSINCQYGPLDIEIFTYDCHHIKLSYHIYWYEPWKTLNFTLCPGNLAFCKADWDWDVNLMNSLEVQFTDHSQGNINNWSWDFGDGNSSNQQHPLHTYTSAGTYQVVLEVMDTSSFPPCIDSDTQNVTVADLNYYNLAGQVFAGSFPHPSGKADLYYLTPDGFSHLDSCSLNVNGVYFFYQVPEGNYLVQISKVTTGNPAMVYWPTYFGDQINWQNSQLLSLQTDYFQGDIHLSPLLPQSPGPGSISGSAMIILNGNQVPAANVEIMLADGSNNFISYTYSGATGEYVFPNLNYGTYKLHAEIPGLSLPPVIVTLDANQPDIINVMVLSNNPSIGIIENENDIGIGPVYPNPSSGLAKMEVILNKPEQLSITLYNIVGQLLSEQNFDRGNGKHILELSLDNLPSGLYFIDIKTKNQHFARKKLELIR
ncbi:MAG: PKD domain-containing protein [Bacteroidales bacterium]